MDALPSFEFARGTVTQLITLATGIIGVSVTFAKDARAGIKPYQRARLYRSWKCFLVSILFGGWALLALTGTIARPNPQASDIYARNIVLPTALQILAFLAGMLSFIRHARV